VTAIDGKRRSAHVGKAWEEAMSDSDGKRIPDILITAAPPRIVDELARIDEEPDGGLPECS
jgi:hypothetical protein